MLGGELIRVRDIAAVDVPQHFVIRQRGAEGELRSIRAEDEPVRVLAIRIEPQERIIVDVPLVLEFFDRECVAGGVALARIHERIRRKAVDGRIVVQPVGGAARKWSVDQIIHIRHLHERAGVIRRIEPRNRRERPEVCERARVAVRQCRAWRARRDVGRADVVRGTVEVGKDVADDVEQLHVVPAGAITVRYAEVQVRNRFTIGVVGLAVHASGIEIAAPRFGDCRIVSAAVQDVIDGVVRRHVKRKEIQRIACAVELIVVPVRLVVSRGADVVRKQPIRRRTTRFHRKFVIKRRSADCNLRRAVSGIRAGFDDLIDVAGKSGRIRGCRRPARVHLNFLLAQRRQRGDRRRVGFTDYRNAVELVRNLIVVSAADVDALIPRLLPRRHRHARRRSNRAIRLIERAGSAKCGCCALLRGVVRKHVARRAGAHEAGAGDAVDFGDGFQRGNEQHRNVCGLIGENRDARLRSRRVSRFLHADCVRVGRE